MKASVREQSEQGLAAGLSVLVFFSNGGGANFHIIR